MCATAVGAVVGCSATLSKEKVGKPPAGPLTLAVKADDGFVPPPYPVFPHGNTLTQSLQDTDPQVGQFLAFYSKQGGVSFPQISRSQLAAFPNRYLDIADNGLNLGSGHYNSSLVCQSCHDSDWKVSGTDLPNMSFWAQPSVSTSSDGPASLAANWSLFGDWSASIKALAGRDPVFLAQLETTRDLSPHQPDVVDNLCLRCHSPLGQRQAEQNHTAFSHYMLYAAPANSGYKNPFPDKTYTQPQYANYGALGRDGVSCSSCHSVAPSSGQPWNGTDYTVFYGSTSGSIFGDNLPSRLKSAGEPVQPPQYPFTATMTTQPGAILGPDTGLNTGPMAAAGLSLQTAATAGGAHSYLRDSTVCGSCHVVILPKVPVGYSDKLSIESVVARGGYERPASCSTAQKYFTGDFLKDPCVGLAYEQTTYFEWLNSGYPSDTSTCLTCHMQLAEPPSPNDGNVEVAQINTDLKGYYGDTQELTPRQYNRHTLLGINLFVHEMFQQFGDVLGLQFYQPSSSRVPPYLQSPDILNRTPILISNPGAEDGNANGWVAASGGGIQAVSQAKGGQGQAVTPSHGKYFFQLTGTGAAASLDIDVSRYAAFIDQKNGAVSVTWGATVYCDKATCGAVTLTPLGQGTTSTGAAGTLVPQPAQPRWIPQQGTLALNAGTRHLSLSLGPSFADDLFLSLRLPDGSVAPLQESAKDYAMAQNLLNAEQSILDLATNTSQGTFNPRRPAVQVSLGTPTTSQGNLTVPVTVTSSVGHKFPSGAPFRRAFIQFEVLDGKGTVLWASGQPNPQGAICAGNCLPDNSNILQSEFTSDYKKLQPHYQTITSQQQVQIYEAKAVDDSNKLSTLELQLFKDVKDNRLLPQGWVAPSQRGPTEMLFGLNLQQLARLTEPSSIVLGPNDQSISSDPDYSTSPASGSDRLTYQIPLSQISNWATIRVRMNYQSIPPPYLNARFRDALLGDNGAPSAPGPAMQRLIYMSSRLNTQTGLKFAPNPSDPKSQIDFVNNWTMVLSEATLQK
ncbi:hypothetical protein [Hyalangium gracile]|uniref:hypothetical protein n=1 Tax=Hyalangium gracile TaxID=394092 RepID=UPI001CCC7449|nr:hypothetical protein [Hyalangium gracile]